MVNGVVSEILLTGRRGKVIGYWAYGYYDPNFPYQGNPYELKIKGKQIK